MSNSFYKSNVLAGLAFMAFVSPMTTHANQPANQLEVSPSQCVAMRQGQTCYVDVIIKWQASKIGDYCLHASTTSKPLQCWQQTQSAKLSQEMTSKENITFTLQAKHSETILAKGSLAMAWVYDKKSRKNVSWRMF